MGRRFCSLDQTRLALENTLVDGNYVIPSPKLNEKQKKVFSENRSVFSPKSGEDQKKKKKKERSSPQFGTIFGRNLKDLFVLAGSFSSDHPALKSR